MTTKSLDFMINVSNEIVGNFSYQSYNFAWLGLNYQLYNCCSYHVIDIMVCMTVKNKTWFKTIEQRYTYISVVFRLWINSDLLQYSTNHIIHFESI